MAELDAIAQTLRRQRKDLDELIEHTSARQNEAAQLVEQIENLRRRAEETHRRFRLPVMEPKEEASPYAGKRALIADDDPAIRRLFETLASRQRIECDSAANGAEAIAALKQRQYAMMFLDLMMPRIDGWGVLDYLRARSEVRVPSLFIITAFLDQSVSAADSAIVSGIIYKPIDADDIAALMRQCAGGGSPTGVLQRTRHRLIAATV